MKFKFKIIIILLAVIVLLGVGIYPMMKKKVQPENAKAASEPLKQGTLKIYALQNQGHLDKVIKDGIDTFKTKYPQIKIETVLFDSGYGESIKEYNKRILTDTMAGNGPDVILVNSNEGSIMKLQNSGMLEDIKPYMDGDKDFKKEDYNMNVINGGMFKGKLTMLPINYYVKGYITTSEILKRNNIHLKDNPTQNEFFKAVEPYAASIKNSKDKTLFAHPMSIAQFIASSGIDFVDYENKKADFDKKEFKDVVNNYKCLYQYSPKVDPGSGSGEEGMEAIKNGTTTFSIDEDYLQTPTELLSSESIIKYNVKEKEIVNSMPMYDGGDKVTAIPFECMAINKNSKNKQADYDFIKSALDDEKLGSYMLSVKKSSIEAAKNEYNNEVVGKEEPLNKNTKVLMEKPSADLDKYFDKISNNVGKTIFIDKDLEDIMNECLKPYFQDKTSYDSAVRELKNKVKIYLNE